MILWSQRKIYVDNWTGVCKIKWANSGEEAPSGAECVVAKLIPKMLHPTMKLEGIRTEPHIQMHHIYHILHYLLQAIAGKPPPLGNQSRTAGKRVFFCGPPRRDRTSSAMSQGSPALLLVGVAVAQKKKIFGKTRQSSSRQRYPLNLDLCIYNMY